MSFTVFSYHCSDGYRTVITDNKVSLGYSVEEFKNMSELEIYTFLESELEKARKNSP